MMADGKAMETSSATSLQPSATNPFERLCQIVSQLRAPGGCPWDREQTHESLVPGLLEEAYEVAGAIRTNDEANLREELGDLLLQVVMHAQIASEAGRFAIEDVCRGVAEKLLRRHPHVFPGAGVADPLCTILARCSSSGTRSSARRRIRTRNRILLA